MTKESIFGCSQVKVDLANVKEPILLFVLAFILSVEEMAPTSMSWRPCKGRGHRAHSPPPPCGFQGQAPEAGVGSKHIKPAEPSGDPSTLSYNRTGAQQWDLNLSPVLGTQPRVPSPH